MFQNGGRPGVRSSTRLRPEALSLALRSSAGDFQLRLQSFLSMKRIDARRKNASASWLRFSESLASRRQRLSQAMERSTIQHFAQGDKPLDPIGTFDDFNVEMRQNLCKRSRKLRSLITAVGEERLQERKHPEQDTTITPPSRSCMSAG